MTLTDSLPANRPGDRVRFYLYDRYHFEGGKTVTDKTRQIVDRYEFLEHSLALPEILSDAAKYSSMMKEYNSLGPVVDVIRV